MLRSSQLQRSKPSLVARKAFTVAGRPACLVAPKRARTSFQTRTAAVETVVTEQNVDDSEELHHLPDRPRVQPDTKHDGILMQVRFTSTLPGLAQLQQLNRLLLR